jgi:hypothetical protein
MLVNMTDLSHQQHVSPILPAKLALAAFALALFAGCLSAPMSSVTDGARPTHRLDNGDGTTTFEFVFPHDRTWDKTAAMDRIREYLVTDARLNGFSGYDTINAVVQFVSKVSEVSAAMDILADGTAGDSGDASAEEKARFVRVIEHVRFKT